MSAPIGLVELINVVLAIAGVWAMLPEARGLAIKLWRLAVPSTCAIVVGLVMLAGTSTSLTQDAFWVATGLIGWGGGQLRGRSLRVETDQFWGLVRLSGVWDGVVVASAIVLCTALDTVFSLIPSGAFLSHLHLAALTAFLAGYLAGRAWKIGTRAILSPHVPLQQPPDGG